MNIILISRQGSTPKQWNINNFSQLCSALVLIFLVVGFIGGIFYWLGTQRSPSAYVTEWRSELTRQLHETQRIRDNAKARVDELVSRVAGLQSHVTRLDALGDKLTTMAEIDDSEFGFLQAPALGGPDEQEEPQVFSDVIKQLNEALMEREHQLTVLEEVLRTRNLNDEVYPAGRPTKSGWISSYYGYRNSPFSGRREYHKGIDIAGKTGSDIIAVAGGVVTWAGKRYGYGNLVEIDHGNGYVTRYGHASEVKVQQGQSVKKGDLVALMGSTGRSTGPHVHFEVMKNGKQVNPMNFVQQSK